MSISNQSTAPLHFALPADGANELQSHLNLGRFEIVAEGGSSTLRWKHEFTGEVALVHALLVFQHLWKNGWNEATMLGWSHRNTVHSIVSFGRNQFVPGEPKIPTDAELAQLGCLARRIDPNLATLKGLNCQGEEMKVVFQGSHSILQAAFAFEEATTEEPYWKAASIEVLDERNEPHLIASIAL